MVKDKNAIVTGGTGGIDREIAGTLAQNGANIVINYRRYSEEVESLVEGLRSSGVKIVACKCDVSNKEEVVSFMREIKDKFESIDTLVNNAGITKDGLIIRMSEKDFNDIIGVNLRRAFNTTKVVSSIMVKQRYGRITDISSVVGATGDTGQCDHVASKIGVIRFSKPVAKEPTTRNINASVIAPGYINTDMTSVLPDRAKEEVIKTIPMKKIGEPREVANLVLLLSSGLSDYITGQVINVDGGMVML